MADPLLAKAFASAAPTHFAWQTQSPVVSDEERTLLRAAFDPLGRRVLDLGCAEGETLKHLGEPPGAVGLDLFVDKVRFAQQHVQARFVAGSGLELPFGAGSFDHVLVRDVFHHVDRPEILVNECRRVLARRGRIDVLEPCRYNPLIFVHALARPEERGELRSTGPRLASLLAPRFEVVRVEHFQPLPLHRLVYHPDIGRPDWAQRTLIRKLVAGAERVAGWLIPSGAWAYLHLRGEAR